MMTLGQRIQQLRIAAGLSQEALGAQLETTRQTVSHWERDQAFPTIDRVVRLSRIFDVTTDSLLAEGISTFAAAGTLFSCGVWRGADMEIVETERFAYVISTAGDCLSARLYRSSSDGKRLCAIVTRHQKELRTAYAFCTADGQCIANDDSLAAMLNQPYDADVKGRLCQRETFCVDHSDAPLPTVQEAGICRCLLAWRMGDSLTVAPERFNFFLCTGQTEYIMNITPQETDIYCGASFNIPFEMGLFGYGQYFRIRNLGDNTQPFCRFFSDFSCELQQVDIPTDDVQLGMCAQTGGGLMWCVKRYSDNEIVLQGCGTDEYIYRRNDARLERFKSAT